MNDYVLDENSRWVATAGFQDFVRKRGFTVCCPVMRVTVNRREMLIVGIMTVNAVFEGKERVITDGETWWYIFCTDAGAKTHVVQRLDDDVVTILREVLAKILVEA